MRILVYMPIELIEIDDINSCFINLYRANCDIENLDGANVIFEIDLSPFCTSGAGSNSCNEGFEIDLIIADLKN